MELSDLQTSFSQAPPGCSALEARVRQICGHCYVNNKCWLSWLSAAATAEQVVYDDLVARERRLRAAEADLAEAAAEREAAAAKREAAAAAAAAQREAALTVREQAAAAAAAERERAAARREEAASAAERRASELRADAAAEAVCASRFRVVRWGMRRRPRPPRE